VIDYIEDVLNIGHLPMADKESARGFDQLYLMDLAATLLRLRE
jgi:hypothetical protein